VRALRGLPLPGRLSTVPVSRNFFNSLLTPCFAQLFSGNTPVNVFAMYRFKCSLLCTSSNTVCYVPLQIQFAMYLFKCSLLCTSSNTVCYVPLQIQFAMYLFKYSLLCTPSNTVCYVPLQIQFAMYPFKYSLLCTPSNTVCYVPLQIQTFFYQHLVLVAEYHVDC